MGVCSAICLILITVLGEWTSLLRIVLKNELKLTGYLVPPVGVAMVAGCGMGKKLTSLGPTWTLQILTWAPFLDLFINICLTLLGYIPGHIHAFYLLYVYYDRKEQAHEGMYATRRAPGIYSDKVQTGGIGYGTMAARRAAPPPAAPGAYEGGPAYNWGVKPWVIYGGADY